MKKVDVPSNLGYITSTTKSYWCHLCQKEFSRLYIENTEVHCRNCGKTFCEEINSQNTNEHPSNYQPYEQPRRVREPRASIFEMLSSLMSFNEEAHMENIINYLMANDPNKYGNPPASIEEVNKLEKIIVTNENINDVKRMAAESCCSVCKDDFVIAQSLLKLPCNHIFHDECILPWLKERNSCPTCRFELKTDDDDYEKKKNEKREEVRQTVNQQ